MELGLLQPLVLRDVVIDLQDCDGMPLTVSTQNLMAGDEDLSAIATGMQ